MKKLHLLRDDRGAAVVEMAFALPAFVMLLWSMVQLGLVYRANSGLQNALGQGARYASLAQTLDQGVGVLGGRDREDGVTGVQPVLDELGHGVDEKGMIVVKLHRV